MFSHGVTLFKIFGIEIRIDLSWALLFLLITWSLARGLFPFRYQDLPTETYWWMGVAGALGLFVSILLHELCHSLVARRFGIPIRGITLFIFGGVSEMTGEPPRPKVEFLMAIVGPLCSAVLGVILWRLAVWGKGAQWPVPLRGVIGYLAWINFIVAIFNMLPAYPLDGGRVLRSILWGARHDLRWATRVASGIGSWFGIALCVWGLLRILLTGDFIGGIWYFIIGMFLRGAAHASYQQLIIRKNLEGEPVRRFMRPNPVTVPPGLTVAQFVEDYLYHYHYRVFPVVQEGRLVGCVGVEQVRRVPRAEWAERHVGDLVSVCSPDNSIGPDADVMKALEQMTRTQADHLMVVDRGGLLGVITLQDLLNFLSVKMDLGEQGQGQSQGRAA